MKILVAEPLAPAGIELLKAQPGWDIVVSNPKEYAQHLADVRRTDRAQRREGQRRRFWRRPRSCGSSAAPASASTTSTCRAATAAGVLVMNTPGGNAVSVAEHTIALMLSLARAIPQASASTKAGKWEKKKFLGNELRGKTLGIIGLGSIGREVVKRAAPFEMRIIASDPYVSSQTAADLGVELVDLKTLYRAERLHHAAHGADAGDAAR